jgi:ubiquitin-activating enzyme E1
MDFINAAAQIRAFNYGLKLNMTRETMAAMASNVMVPEFTPKSGVKIQVNENENENNEAGSSESAGMMRARGFPRSARDPLATIMLLSSLHVERGCSAKG